MVKPEKKDEVKEIKKRLSESSTVILTDYRGLDVQLMNELRRKLRDASIEYKIHKNTLIKIAAEKANMIGLGQFLTGPTAIAYIKENPIESAKLLNDFAKTNKVFNIKGGLLDGEIIDADKIVALASLPSRDELIAKLMGSLMAPLTRLVGVLSNPTRKLVVTLDQIAKQKA